MFFCDVSIFFLHCFHCFGDCFFHVFWICPFLGGLFFPFWGGIFFPFSGGGGDSVCSKMPNDQTSHQFGCVESLS